MRILVVIDQYGWAFDFAARGIKKYSKHDVVIKRWSDVVKPNQYDCVFYMNRSCLMATPHSRRATIKNKCVGIRGGLPLMSCDQPIMGWKNAPNQINTYNYLKDKYPNEKIYLCRNAVDTEIFKPIKRPKNRFGVGWAGNPTQPTKQYKLLFELNYPIEMQKRWGVQFFKKDRSRQEMVDFYSSIDVYINVSYQEGFSMTLLEAAATTLPIVCTNAGGHAEFVDSEWVIPSRPPSTVIKEMNRKLRILKTNPKLRLELGQKNLRKVLDKWTWKKTTKKYDYMFEA